MRLVERDVEIADPECEVDGVEIVECDWKGWKVREEKDGRECRERLSHVRWDAGEVPR